MLTVLDVLDATVARCGEREAFVEGDRRLTFAELQRRALAFGAHLQGLGVGHGDVVSLLMPSSIEFAVAYVGAMSAGAVTSAVNPRLGSQERASIAARTNPRVSVVPDGVEVGPEWGVAVPVSEVLCVADGVPVDCAVSSTDTVAIVWTSGTTGLPKGAMYDHATMRAIHEGMGDLSVDGDRRVVSLPFAHVGFMTRAWDDIANGVTMVLVSDPWTAAEQVALIERERVTMVTGVPTQWLKMLDEPALATMDLSRVRLAGIGGAAVAPELVRAMREQLGCPVMTRYTSTEAGLATGTRLGDDDEVVATTVGVPSSVVEMRLVDPSTESSVEAGEVGEIRLRSDAMFRGYWRDEHETAAAIDSDGFLRTGDLGYVGTDGNLRIVGRLKEMYIRGGYNVYPVEVEAVLADHPDIAQVAVVGAAAPVVGEIGVAFVVAAAGAPKVDVTTVRDWCRSRLADYKSPERVVLVDALPVNAMHKVDKTVLREQAKEYV